MTLREAKRHYEVRLTIKDCYQRTRSSKSGMLLAPGVWHHFSYLRSQPGQGGDADTETRDLRAELVAAEAAHYAKTEGKTSSSAAQTLPSSTKRELEPPPQDEDEDPEAKRRRILEETRDIDADSVGSDSESSDEDSDDEDETAELMRELEKIKRERAEQKAREVRSLLTML